MKKQRAVWRWGRSGVVAVDRVVDGSEERLWVNARLPSVAERASFGVCVELLFWYWRPRVMRAGLDVLWEYFHADSLLVAMRRRDDFTRLLIYTAAREAIVDDRQTGVRAVLRPTAIGRRVTVDPTWASFATFVGAARAEEATALVLNGGNLDVDDVARTATRSA